MPTGAGDARTPRVTAVTRSSIPKSCQAITNTRGPKPESAASPQVRVEPAAEMHTSIRHEKPAVSRRRLLSLATPPGSPKQVLRSFDLRYFSFLAPSIFELATM